MITKQLLQICMMHLIILNLCQENHQSHELSMMLLRVSTTHTTNRSSSNNDQNKVDRGERTAIFWQAVGACHGARWHHRCGGSWRHCLFQTWPPDENSPRPATGPSHREPPSPTDLASQPTNLIHPTDGPPSPSESDAELAIGHYTSLSLLFLSTQMKRQEFCWRCFSCYILEYQKT